MKKSILHTLGLAAMAALLCVFCGDNTTDGSEGGQVDALLNRYNNGGGAGLVKYTVRFNANGGTGEIPPDVTVSAGNEIKLPAKGGMSNGTMDFDGWNTEANGTGATYPGGSTYTVTGNITLYAKWNDGFTPTTYTIVFNANEGSGTAPNNLIVNAGSSVTLPGRGNLARDGYEFGGWNTHSSGTGYTYAAGESYTPTASIELFAKWNTGWVSKGNDIKNYRTVKIGTQTWMAENLDNPVNGSECYDNNSANCAKYGRLYMWLAARSACPAGWHLPLSAEWDILMEEVGGSSTAGTKLKSATGWSVDFGTDDYGFSALPGGIGYSGDNFGDADNNGWWWSATEVNTGSAWRWSMTYSGEDVSRSQSDKANMLSVRCVQDVDITHEVFVDSRDGKTYKKVAIGTQTWMGENLNYNASGSACFNNDTSTCTTYGRYYNWATAMNGASSSSISPSGVQGVCPGGWHLPSDAEWTVLVNYAGGESMAGRKLKSASSWNNYGNGADAFGFSALSGGVGWSLSGYNYIIFDDSGVMGWWWSATEYDAGSAMLLEMGYNGDGAGTSNQEKMNMCSVRCVEN
jgi:uncharacterized protein (TIGR02145 family)